VVRVAEMAGALGLLGLAISASSGSASPAQQPLPVGQARYTESCGGCHGLLGASVPGDIPTLRDQVGTFLCTQEGRDYVIRLPNVAFSNMDDETLAKTMNFVMFDLGGDSVPRRLDPVRYTAAEVGALRKSPLKAQQVLRMRAAIWERATRECATS